MPIDGMTDKNTLHTQNGVQRNYVVRVVFRVGCKEFQRCYLGGCRQFDSLS